MISAQSNLEASKIGSDPKRRVACYARVSSHDQATGLESQIRALRVFCEQNGVTNWELFADEGISGVKASRPSLDRMMKAVENGEIETVVVFAFSRFARSVSHMLKGLECMRAHQTNFVSVSERIDLSTSLGNLIFVLISAMAQLERDLLIERVRAGLQNAKAKGIRIGRERKRNSALIETLLEAGLSQRAVARIAKCSNGSVFAQKKEWLARKAREAKEAQTKFDAPPSFAVAADSSASAPNVPPPEETERLPTSNQLT